MSKVGDSAIRLLVTNSKKYCRLCEVSEKMMLTSGQLANHKNCGVKQARDFVKLHGIKRIKVKL